MALPAIGVAIRVAAAVARRAVAGYAKKALARAAVRRIAHATRTGTQFKLETELDWHDKAVTKKVNKHMRRQTIAAAKHLQKSIVRNINVPVVHSGSQVIRSMPGEYPRKESGALRKSIKINTVTNKSGTTSRVGTDSPYASILEFDLDRSFIRRTAAEERKTVERIMSKKMK